MDMGGGFGRRLILTAESIDGDVIANDILVGVDSVVEGASATFKTTSLLVLGIDDLIRRSLDTVSRGENEWSLISMLSLLVPIQYLVENWSGSGSGSGSRYSSQREDNGRELHRDN